MGRGCLISKHGVFLCLIGLWLAGSARIIWFLEWQKGAFDNDNDNDATGSTMGVPITAQNSAASWMIEEKKEEIEKKVSGAFVQVVTRVEGLPSSPSSLQQDPFCVLWEGVNTDEWWTHHVDWEIMHQDDTHSCFQPIAEEKKAQLFQKLYKQQYSSNACKNVVYKKMWSSSWANDLRNVVDGLLHASHQEQPFQVTTMPWKRALPAVCSSEDMFCYFLPLSNCSRIEATEEINKTGLLERDEVKNDRLFQKPTRWYLEYVTRPQTWLRRRVHQFIQQQQQLKTPCTVMFVHRERDDQSRKDRSLATHLKAPNFTIVHKGDIERNVFLLTNDDATIDEALALDDDRHEWIYLTPRLLPDGGWNAIDLKTSDDAVDHVVRILSTLQLVRRCHSMIQSDGLLTEYVWGEIQDQHPKTAWDTYVIPGSDVSKGNDTLEGIGAFPNVTVADQFPNLQLTNNEDFCLPWDVNSDEWWTHHVDWKISLENDTHYCFQKMTGDQAETLRALYQRQFESDCSNTITKKMVSAGITNDLRSVVDGLLTGAKTGRPFVNARMPWHYASPKPFDISTAACPTQDMFCYFLPMSNCPRIAVVDEIKKVFKFVENHGKVHGLNLHLEPVRWFLESISRPQTWLRHRVYQFTKQQNVQQPCTVIHVRRGDVISHGKSSRRYHAIKEYLTPKWTEQNILVFTDDHNAITEALTEFPDRHWMFMNRKRYSGNEGGFERHLPSNDPIYEMTVLLSTFQMARKCNSMVKSSSAFGEYIWGEVLDQNKTARLYDIDEKKKNVLNINNQASAAISKAYSNVTYVNEAETA